MRRAQWLIHVAEHMCGREARTVVFEPLVADWRFEWQNAHGARRVAIAITGGWSFAVSLAQCLRPVHGFAATPTAAVAVTTLLFGVAGTFLALQPIHYRWFGAGVTFSWWAPYPSAPHLVYYAPYVLARTLGFALLPVMVLATMAGHSWRRRASTVAAVLVAMVMVEGFVAPAAMYSRDREAIATVPEEHRAMWLRNYENLVDVVQEMRSHDAAIARAAWLNVRDKLEAIVAASAFALLGIAIGHVRRRADVAPSLQVTVFWWLGAWLLYNALYHWSTFLVIILSLSRDWKPWVASLIFGVIAVMVLISTRTGAANRLRQGYSGAA
jgi:hypothetical protein